MDKQTGTVSEKGDHSIVHAYSCNVCEGLVDLPYTTRLQYMGNAWSVKNRWANWNTGGGSELVTTALCMHRVVMYVKALWTFHTPHAYHAWAMRGP